MKSEIVKIGILQISILVEYDKVSFYSKEEEKPLAARVPASEIEEDTGYKNCN